MWHLSQWTETQNCNIWMSFVSLSLMRFDLFNEDNIFCLGKREQNLKKKLFVTYENVSVITRSQQLVISVAYV
jgi:hypothetical protein